MTKKQIDKMLLEGCESRDFNKVRLAINFGADVETKDKLGYTPLHWASDVKTAKLLLERGADVKAKDNWGQTPLHLASISNHIETVRFFIERGADVEAKDIHGYTPLDLASRDEMKALLKKYMK
jgi:ankyrin repeat protein